MNKKYDCDDQASIVDGLRNGDSRAYESLYRCCYRAISSFIRSNSGTEEDARDIFHDGVIIFIRNLRKPEFKLTAKSCVYLYSVCRFQWLNRLKKKGKNLQDIDEINPEYIAVYDKEWAERKEYEERHSIISRLLEKWENTACQKILLAFYYRKTDLKKIAKDLDYTYDFVRIKKKRCIRNFEKLVRAHPAFQEE